MPKIGKRVKQITWVASAALALAITVFGFFAAWGTSVFDALRRVAEVEYDDYPGLGVFVKSIDNLSNTGNKWWLYKVNGVYGTVSASRFLLENRDSVVWEYTSFFPF